MLRLTKFSFATALLASAAIAMSSPAAAACKKMGFLVNDYGKDGPSRDAQVLLDKHIAKWADENGITEYSVGKKSVECELYLNLILFDEHTCTASATVCWGGSKQPKAKSQSAKAKTKKDTQSKQAKAKSENSKPKAVKTVATKDDTSDKKAAAKKAVEAKQPSSEPATKSAAKADAANPSIETSAIPRYVPEPDAKAPEPANAAATLKPPVAEEKPETTSVAAKKPAEAEVPLSAVTSGTNETAATPPQSVEAVQAERDAADRAAAAAERAAAAAEKAARAAQLAAEAAKQAAAVSNRASEVTVPPVSPAAP